ncbi:MAG: hypothetical protein LBD48_02815, partial [Treponema sp.]|nr:hypothetical protein [Treponema sp.]
AAAQKAPSKTAKPAAKSAASTTAAVKKTAVKPAVKPERASIVQPSVQTDYSGSTPPATDRLPANPASSELAQNSHGPLSHRRPLIVFPK